MKITDKHIKLFELIKEVSENNNSGLNIDEIKDRLNFSSSFEVMEKAKDLIEKGYLDQDLNIVKEIGKEDIFYLPFYGFAQCGNYGKEILDNYPREKFPVNEDILPIGDKNKLFVTRAKGDSMEPFIHSGDNILIQYESSYNDENDLLLVIHNNKPKIKKVKVIKDKVFLVSLNKKHKDIELEEFHDDIDIIGIVKENLGKI